MIIDNYLKTSTERTTDITSLNAKWYLGGWKGDDSFWKGYIDDVIIYNRALTEQDICNIYNSYPK